MIALTAGGSVVKKSKTYEAAKRLLFVSNGIVCSLSLYVIAAAFFVVFASGNGMNSLEASVASSIKSNLALFGMLASVETAMLFLIHYVKCGQKKLFGNVKSSSSKATNMSSSKGGFSSGASSSGKTTGMSSFKL